jgi:hypothetical protein
MQLHVWYVHDGHSINLLYFQGKKSICLEVDISFATMLIQTYSIYIYKVAIGQLQCCVKQKYICKNIE